MEAATIPTTPTGDDNDEKENVMEQLFRACVEEVKLGAYLISALEVALLVLKVVHDIEEIDYDRHQSHHLLLQSIL